MARLTHEELEWETCRRHFWYFVDTYCWVETKEDGQGEWAPFKLWPEQRPVADDMQAHRRLVILKARQLGLTWLCVAFALWLMLFHPIATVLMFSLRDIEAKKLLKRLRGMHERLPAWMRQRIKGHVDNQHEVEFANGSTAQALTTAGDSYTASLVVVDEADLLPDLAGLLESIEPTIGDGGRMVLVSKTDKSKPESAFKKIYRAARAKTTYWHPIFLRWDARPDRSQEWYEEEKRASLAATGSLDGFHANYPATDAEALSPRTLDKRIAPAWIEQCYAELPGVDVAGLAPALPGLVVYRLPIPGRKYVCGADPAQGNPTSDDSAGEMFDAETGEQVAELAGKFEMTVFGGYLGKLCTWYNRAPVMVEENNHGHTVIKHLRENFPQIRRLVGHLGRDGWASSTLGKTMLYDAVADAFKNGEVMIHSFRLFTQLCSIDGNTLRAPEGQLDDLADGCGFAIVGRLKSRPALYRAS